MSWNGSGVFNRLFSWVADAAAGIDITASRTDDDTNDIVTNGFGNCITRDGQGSASANQPMNGFRHTGVGNGQASTDYAALGQVQAGIGLNWSVASGSSDAITAIYTPSLTALVDGQLCFFRATASNATTTPTFAPNGLTAHTITKEGGTALVAGDIAGDLAEVILRYNLANTRWELLNPMSDVDPTTGWGLTTSSEVFSVATSNPPFGFDMPINLGLVASINTPTDTILTIAVKGNNGSDPSATNPVLIPFRDSTIANGDPIWVAVTSALSISTNSTGATLGTTNGVPFRLWVVAFNNAGTAVLALWQSLTSGSTATVSFLNEAAVQSTTAIGGSATSANVFYTPNGTTLSNKAFRIIGYVDYANGLTTAGTYASAPTTVQLFGPGIKKPGDEVQTVYTTEATQETGFTNTAYTATAHASVTIALSSSPNIVYVTASGSTLNTTASDAVTCRLSRNATNNTNMFGSEAENQAFTGSAVNSFNIFGVDVPGTTSSINYTVQLKVNAGSGTINPGGTTLAMIAKEIMI